MIARPHHIDPTLATARVVLAYKTSQECQSFVGLGITAAHNAKTLRRHGVWAEAWACTSGQALLDRLRQTIERAHAKNQLEPTHVIINALWIPSAELEAMAHEHPEVVFTVVSHSNFAFLAADPHAVKLLREAVDLQHHTSNVKVAGNSTKFTDEATTLWGVNVTHLPNLYDLSEPMAPAKSRWTGDALRLGLFGAARILKNGLTAAAAAVDLALTLNVQTELYVSEKDETGAIRELTDGVRNLRVVHTGWLQWPAFRRLVAQMHLVLQPSFTESFNVVVADSVHAGVPAVCSEAIDWVPHFWQANPDDAGDVARVGKQLLHTPNAVEDGRAALRAYVDAGVVEWLRFLVPSVPPAAARALAA
jgi:hypothetical protein